MKVLHICWSANIGGIEQQVLDLAGSQLGREDITADVFFSKSGGVLKKNFENLGLSLFSGDLKKGFDLDFIKYRKIYRLFKKYDILQFHSFNLFIAVAAVLSGKKIIYTEHGNFGIGRKLRFTEKINSVLLNIFLRKYVDYLTFNSAFTRDFACKRYKIENTRKSVVYNGIAQNITNESVFDEKITSRLGNKFVIGLVSRFVGYKRIDKAIRVFARFEHKNNSRLLLVGNGPEMELLVDLAGKLEISEQVIFAGYQVNAKSFYELMDVLLVTSYNEPFGLVACEGLSAGKPVLVMADGGGLVEIIEGLEKNDVIGNEEKLLARLNYYFENREQQNGQSLIRKNYVLDHFGIGIMEKEFYAIYRKVLSGFANS